jgi:hypothetical protein
MKIKQHMVQIFHGWLCPTTAVLTGHLKDKLFPAKLAPFSKQIFVSCTVEDASLLLNYCCLLRVLYLNLML